MAKAIGAEGVVAFFAFLFVEATLTTAASAGVGQMLGSAAGGGGCATTWALRPTLGGRGNAEGDRKAVAMDCRSGFENMARGFACGWLVASPFFNG